MEITVEGRSLEGVRDALLLLRDINTYYKQEKESRLFFDGPLNKAIAFISKEEREANGKGFAKFNQSASRDWPKDAPVEIKSDVLGTLFSVNVPCILETPLEKPMLRDVLLHEEMVPSREGDKIYPSLEDMKYAAGDFYLDEERIINEVRLKREYEVLLHDEARSFLAFRARLNAMQRVPLNNKDQQNVFPE